MICDRCANQIVGQAVRAGKLSPRQAPWAMGYLRLDPLGFIYYVANAPAMMPEPDEGWHDDWM